MGNETDQIFPASEVFTKKELARLTMYRGAVLAGFYTDWDGSTITTNTEFLKNFTSFSGLTEYPFTRDELDRFIELKGAIKANYYSDSCGNPTRRSIRNQSVQTSQTQIPAAPEIVNGDINPNPTPLT